MNEMQLLGSLIPAHPDFLPILQNIREEYGIEEISPGDDSIKELILNEGIDLEIIKQDIEDQLRANPEFLPSNAVKFVQSYKKYQSGSFEFPELQEVSEELRNNIIGLLSLMVKIFEPFYIGLESFYTTATDMVLDILITGRTSEAPPDWFGKVFTIPVFGNPVVVAMASQISDPKAISDEFRKIYTETFGKDKPKITKGQLNTAEYFAMKMKGMKIKDIADEYILRHPSEFPTNPNSNEYRAAKRKREEILKKNMQRLQKILDRLLGDKN